MQYEVEEIEVMAEKMQNELLGTGWEANHEFEMVESGYEEQCEQNRHDYIEIRRPDRKVVCGYHPNDDAFDLNAALQFCQGIYEGHMYSEIRALSSAT